MNNAIAISGRFTWWVAERGPVRGTLIGVDVSMMKANAALRSIRRRKGKKCLSNEEWISATDPDARTTKMNAQFANSMFVSHISPDGSGRRRGAWVSRLFAPSARQRPGMLPPTCRRY